MEQQEINMKEVVILFEDHNGDAWCKHLSGAEARLALTFIAALDEGDFNAIPVKPVKIYRREVKNEA
ncbi:TPA: hypothetical protein JLL51_002130 [Escherichia coli]|nr:hypothetical protein [Escherichia coli]